MLERKKLAAGLVAIALLACNNKPAEEKKPDTVQAADKAKTDQKPKDEGLPPPPDVAAAPADAQKTASGLASKVIKPGTGTEHPHAWDKVTVHYTGWTTDGKMFDSSVKPRFPGLKTEPASFPLNRVIPGWTEGLQLMVTGEQRRFWIPESIAYKGQPGAPAGTLVFDVELISFEKMPPPPETPPDVAAPPADAQKGFEGLMSKVITKGTGKVKPKETDYVKVHYTGWTTDGNMFDSSVTRGEPATFPLDKVIKGWTKGVSLMVVGEKRRLWIPKELAYNDKPGKPSGMLVFDVELLDIVSVDAPKDVKAPPGNAEKTKSGLASRVLTKGTGTEHPSAQSTVKVHYTGWTTDGKMFDSSVTRGEPAEFRLDGVIAGWTEGVQLMTVGEKRRFWIPEELAYKGQPGAPAGMLVFDVELLEIH